FTRFRIDTNWCHATRTRRQIANFVRYSAENTRFSLGGIRDWCRRIVARHIVDAARRAAIQRDAEGAAVDRQSPDVLHPPIIKELRGAAALQIVDIAVDPQPASARPVAEFNGAA